MEGTVEFVDEAQTNDGARLDDQFGRESVGAEMEMRNRVRTGQEGAADFATSGVSVSVQNARATVRGLSRECELGAGAIEFGAPFDELRNVLGAFFDEQRYCIGATEAVAGFYGVLFVKTDFVFVTKRDGDAALSPGGGGIAQVGFREDQDAAAFAQLDRGAQSCDTRSDNSV